MKVRNWAFGAGLMVAGYLLASAETLEQVRAVVTQVVSRFEKAGATADLSTLEQSLQTALAKFSQEESQLRTELGVIQQRTVGVTTRTNDIQGLLRELKCLHAKAEHAPTGKVAFLDRQYSQAELAQQIDILLEEQAALDSERMAAASAVEKLSILAEDCGTRSREAKRHLAQMSTYKTISRTQESLASMDQGLTNLQKFLSDSNAYFSGEPVRAAEDLLKLRQQQATAGAKRVTVAEFLAEGASTPPESTSATSPVEPPQSNETPTAESVLLDLQRNVKALASQP